MRRALALAAALALALPGAALAGAPGGLHSAGGWIADGAGRVYLAHGVNMVYKRPPYDPGRAGFGADDARFLAVNGFDSVRLGVVYAAVEPHPGVYDDAYIDSIAATARMLARAGVTSLVDFHQDLYSERFGGEGFPPWGVLDDGLPAQPLTGFPGSYVTSPGLNAAFDNLWSNAPGPGGIGLGARYAAAWQHVAGRLRKVPGVLGYDIINEPWPGRAAATCANPAGCPAFEQGPLAAFEDRAVAAIRRGDPRRPAWYEPVVTSQFGPQYWIPHPPDRNVAMSFHVYCLANSAPTAGVCDQLEQLSLDNARARAAANGDPLLLTEYGATTDRATIARMVARADRARVGWMWWHYCGCSDPTTSGPGSSQALVFDLSRPPAGANVDAAKLALLERPYPQLIAGTPQSWSYDAASRRFSFAYTTARAGGGTAYGPRSRTTIFVPRLHYPRGYRVFVAGGRVVSRRSAQQLVIAPLRGARTVSVTVLPPG